MSSRVSILMNLFSAELTTFEGGKLSIFLREQTIGKLFYCTGSEIFEPNSYSVFIRVITPTVWGCIFIVAVKHNFVHFKPSRH